jgi:hypothetical protein
MEWITVSHDRCQWRARVHTVMNLQVPYKSRKFLSRCVTGGRSTQLHDTSLAIASPSICWRDTPNSGGELSKVTCVYCILSKLWTRRHFLVTLTAALGKIHQLQEPQHIARKGYHVNFPPAHKYRKYIESNTVVKMMQQSASHTMTHHRSHSRWSIHWGSTSSMITVAQLYHHVPPIFFGAYSTICKTLLHSFGFMMHAEKRRENNEYRTCNSGSTNLVSGRCCLSWGQSFWCFYLLLVNLKKKNNMRAACGILTVGWM